MNDRQVEALADCPFCGSTKIDPEGWTSLEQYKGTEQWRSGPSCEECGASAETVEKWNTRSRTPSAPDVAMREACIRAIHSLYADDDSMLGANGRAFARCFSDAINNLDLDALSASKSGEPVDLADPNEIWEEYLADLEGGIASPQGALAFAVDFMHRHAAPTPPQVDREAVARRICDGFTNGNIQFDEADQALQHSCLMAADAVLAPAQEGE